jgi:tyrosyl-tRNA synthetase
MTTTTYGELAERGFLYQTTDEAAAAAMLAAGPVSFYVGFDPTADSLHVGHLLPIMAMRLLQRAGHRPIVLVGGATALIGDPSGKQEARPILTREAVAANAAALRRQLGRFLDTGEGRTAFVDNADWFAPMGFLEFLRDVGHRFSVNRMLTAESVRQRLAGDGGISYLEFSYMLLQAYDFLVLHRDHGCRLQLGGQDQWGNIVAGVDLVRRMAQAEVHGITLPLLTDSAGQKFGKTAGGAVWLDPQRTSVFAYYQFWRNTADTDVARLLKLFTALPPEECAALGAMPAPDINRAKEILAFEATALAHGADEAVKAYLAAGAEFGFADRSGRIATTSAIRDVAATAQADALPTFTITPEALAGEGIWIVALLVDAGLCKSNGEARRLIAGGGAYLGEERIADADRRILTTDLADGAALLRAGKKQVRRIVLADAAP